MSRVRSRAGIWFLAVGLVTAGFAPAAAQPPEPTPPPAPAAPPATSADEERAVLTETVGLLAALQLYQTYLNIGLLADARAEGLYEASALAQLLGSVVVPLGAVDKQMEKLARLPLTDEDLVAVERLRKVNALLRIQGVELQAFWDTGVADRAKKYETARQAAWAELSDLLGLGVKGETAPPPREAAPKP